MPQDFSWLNSSRKRPSTLEHVGDLWTLRFVETNCTAAIRRNEFGLKLRVELEAN